MALDMERLLDSVKQVESGGNTRAVSPAGALGPYQFMPATAEEYGVKDPFNESQARAGARKYLSTLLEQNDNDLNRALAAWNWGPGNLQRNGMENMPDETKGFISKVNNLYNQAPTTSIPSPPDSVAFPGTEPTMLFPGQAPSDVAPQGPALLFPNSNDDERLHSNIVGATNSPDKAARIYNIQGKTGLPTKFIERNLDELEQKVKERSFDPVAFRNESPKLAKWLEADPNRAAVSTDDYDTLSGMEKLWRTFESVPSGVSTGIDQKRMLHLSAKAAMGNITEAEQLERKRIKAEMNKESKLYEEGAPSWFYEATKVVGTNIPLYAEAARKGVIYGLPSGALTGGMIGGPGGVVAGGLAGIGAGTTASVIDQTYTLAVGEAFDDIEGTTDAAGNPVDPVVARYASLVVGVPNAMLEFASLRKAVKVIPGAEKVIGKFTIKGIKKILTRPTVSRALKDFGKKYAAAVGTETWTEGMQEFLNIVAREVAEGDDFDISEGDISQVIGASEAAFKASLVLGSLGAGPKVLETYHDMQTAARNEQFMNRLGELVAESKTQQRSPDAVGDYIANLKEDSDVQNVFIPVEKWRELFQDQAPQAAQEVFGSQQQYSEALTTGGDLVIPIETYTKKLAGTEYHQELTQNMRFNPGELTPTEAAEVAQGEEQIAQRLNTELEEAQAIEAPLSQVYDDVYQKAVDVGMDEISAQRSAVLWRERLRTRAERLGRDPFELYNEKPLLIKRLLPGQQPSPYELQQNKRGSYLPYENMIKLMEQADPSTFLHESGHAWFEELRQDALHPDAPQQLKSDWEAIKEWTGATDENISREAHEQFARGIEAHVMDGKSPSMELREVFAQFRGWLQRIYGAITALNAPLTDEVRDVMDRLLATDKAIEYAREHNIYQHPMFSTEAMTAEEAKVYAALNEAARREAEDSFRAKVLKSLKREDTATWRKARERIHNQVRKELLDTKLYRAIYWLQNGQLPDGTKFEGFDTQLDKDIIHKMGFKLNELPRGISKDQGMHPDITADLLGYSSGREMLRSMHKVPTLNQAVKSETETRLQEEQGTRLTDEDFMAQAAIEVQNDKQLDIFNFELRILKRLGARRERSHPAVLKDLAAQIIDRKPIGQLRPYQYRDAANKAAQRADEAMLNDDLDRAFDAKQQQILNVLLHRQAEETRKHVQKKVKQWQRKLNRSDKKLVRYYNLDMVNAARAIAAAHGIGRKEKTAQAYMDQIRSYDSQTYENLSYQVDIATSDARPLDELTIADFTILENAIEGMLHSSARSQKMRVKGQLMERSAVLGRFANRIAELRRNGSEQDALDRTTTKSERAKSGLMGALAHLRRVEFWADAFDKGDFSGPARKYIYEPVKDAENIYRDAHINIMEQYLGIVRDYAVSREELSAKVDAPEINFQFESKAELLGALLHTGNESNLQKLLRAKRRSGKSWGDYIAETGELNTERWDSFIKRMQDEGILTERDYDFVQAVWDLFEQMKPEAQKAHHEMYGYYLSEISASEIQTPWGTYRGGYYPAVPDRFEAETATMRAEEGLIEMQHPTTLFPATPRGFTKQRVEEFAEPLSMDIGQIGSHLRSVLRFAHLGPAIQDVGRLVNSKEFRVSMREVNPQVVSNTLMPWLHRTAHQIVEEPFKTPGGRAFGNFMRALRRRQAMQIMTANLSVAVQQFTGLSLSMANQNVDAKHMAGAIMRFTRQPVELTKWINDSSVFMKNRIATHAIEVQRVIDKILLTPTKMEKAVDFFNEHGYFLQVGTQAFVDRVTWAAAYEKAMETTPDHEQAVRIADSVVRETQGSFEPADISSFEAGNALIRNMTMFFSFFNMAANLQVTEFQKAMNEMGLARTGRIAYVVMFGFMIPAIAAEAIVQALSGEMFVDDDDDGYLDNLASILIGGPIRMLTAMVPIVGPVAQVGVDRFNDKWYDDRISVSPSISALEAMSRVPYDINKLVTEDDPRLKPIIRDMTITAGIATGLPLAPLSRPLGYWADVEQGYAEPENEVDYVRGLISGREPER